MIFMSIFENTVNYASKKSNYLVRKPAVDSKRGVDDGSQKGGRSVQPAKEGYNIRSL